METPADDSEEMVYMNAQRQKLGGSLPVRSFELETLHKSYTQEEIHCIKHTQTD
jgi:hypothetical protein